MPTSSDTTPVTGRPAVAPRVRLLAVLGLSGALVLGTVAWSFARGADPDGHAGHAGHAGSSGHGWSDPAQGRPEVLGGDLAAGVPVVQRVVHDDDALTVAVGPARPGSNLVRVDTVAADAGHGSHGAGHQAPDAPGPVLVGVDEDDLVEAESLPGTEGLWARVDLPEGDGTVVVEHAGHTARFRVVTGDGGTTSPAWAGDDAPECLAAALATTVAGHRADSARCPSDALADGDATSLTDTVTTLGARGVVRLAVRSDDTARGEAALAVVRRSAAAADVEVVDADDRPRGRTALLDLGGWTPSAEALAAETGLPREQQRVRSDGTWLAPWLLSPGVVDATPGAVLPLDFDVRDDDARRYAETLAAVLPGVAPTSSGYRAWAEVRRTPPAKVLLYAASRANFMSSDLGHPGHETQVGWFPGGTITPVATFESATPSRG